MIRFIKSRAEITPYEYLDQQDLALFRTAAMTSDWFVGVPVFCLNHPAGKPTDNSPDGEPNNEI
jgi:hypothetical protein